MAPPVVPAYMLSLLSRRLSAIGGKFLDTFPGPWLVWEPGKWAVSGMFEPTRSAKGGVQPAPPAADSLSFHLKTRQPLRLGRSSSCDIVINDATVSREHLSLEPGREEGWIVKVLTSSGTTELDGVALAPGAEPSLVSGSGLRVGDVSLTYWTGADLIARLQGK